MTPALFAAAPWFSRRLAALAPSTSVDPPAEAKRTGHVVVVGYGMNGGLLVKVMREARIPFVVVELDPATVREAHEQGIPIQYGDATRPEIQQHAGIDRARVVVFAISDPHATRLAVTLARASNPALHIIVRTRMVKEIEELRRVGANEVIAEEFEAAIEIFTHVLELYHVPRNIVARRPARCAARATRCCAPSGSDAACRRGARRARGGDHRFLPRHRGRRALRDARGEIDLQAAAGAAVIAVVRGEQSFVNPSPEQRLETGDYLVLVGSHDQIERSFDFCTGSGWR